jgi:membrane associated rhomboid family serine protease
MRFYRQRFAAALTPGVLVLLIVLMTVFIATLAGNLTGKFNVYRWFLVTPDVWHGQVWRLLTNSLLPGCPANFITNLIALIMLGSTLEQKWTRYELWLFCSVAAVGSGLVQMLVATVTIVPVMGQAPMVFGLLIAWEFTSSQERGAFPLLGEASVRQVVAALAVLGCVITLITGGFGATVIMLSGGATGWGYLWLRQKWLLAKASHAAPSGRINRLEL